MSPEEHSEIHNMLKKHKLTYLNNQIHLVAKDLILEFYINAYIPLSKDVVVKSKLISLVRGKQINFD